MIFFPWKDDYSVGSQEMDKQHRILLAIINRLYSAMEKKQEKVSLDGILDELITYANTHFISEETLMESSGFPGLTGHKVLHKGFVKFVHERSAQLGEGGLVSALELVYWLKDWLGNHILKEDKAYSPYVDVRRHGGTG